MLVGKNTFSCSPSIALPMIDWNMSNKTTVTYSSDTYPPSNFAEGFSYEDQWTEYKKSSFFKKEEKVIIFDLCWHHDELEDQLYLIGVTNKGEICIWKAPPMQLDNAGTNVSSRGKLDPYRTPTFRRELSRGILYAVEVIQVDQTILVVSGEEGVRIFPWKHLLVSLQQNNVISTQLQYKPYPSPSEGDIEVNQACVRDGFVYGAAGDAFGCYKWDIETAKLIATYRSPRKGYLHSLRMVTGQGSQPLLLTGGEDGILGVWDTNTDSMVEHFHINNNGKGQNPHWISSITSSADDNWWHVGGGQGSTGGYVATFHGPTRSLVKTVSTREQVQRLDVAGLSLLSVGNDAFLSHWNSLSLERKESVRLNSLSGYAIATAPDGRIATSGVGSTIDLFEQGTQRTFRFSLE